jgi:uncharacterized protein
MRPFLFLLIIFSNSLFAQNFKEQEIQFWDKSHTFQLSGTLATPINTKKFPVVVLITGSGQTDRDETLFGLKLFKTISDHLAANGIGVLRYDDRGGYKSKGPSTALSTQEDLSSDATAAIDYLTQEFKFKNIGVIGHSEGGGLAPMIASKNLKFIISLSGPTVKGSEVLIKQNEIIFKKMGMEAAKVDDYISYYFAPMVSLTSQNLDSAAFVKATSLIIDDYNLKAKNISFVFVASTQKVNLPTIEKQINGVWFKSMLSTDYSKYWQNIKIPALALFAEKDVQVDADVNVKALQNMNKSNIQIKILTSHNHLFQIAKTGNTDEYAKLKTSVSDECLNTISNFIKDIYK